MSYLKSDTITEVEDVGGDQTKRTVNGSIDLAEIAETRCLLDDRWQHSKLW